MPASYERLDYQEKRSFIRMKINAAASATLLNSTTTLEGTCHDLSGSGMLLTLSQRVAVGTEMIVNVASQAEDKPMLTAQCTVVRTAPAPKQTSMVGLEINEFIDNGNELNLATA